MVLYLFALGIGLTIMVAYALGGSWGVDVDADAEGGMFSWVSISALAFAATVFGLAGVITVWAGASPFPGVSISVAMGVLGATFHNAFFSWLRRTEASSEVTNQDLQGANGLVVLGVSAKRRGQIVVGAAGQRLRISALPARWEDRLAKGERVTIVGVDGGVALIARQEQEKADGE